MKICFYTAGILILIHGAMITVGVIRAKRAVSLESWAKRHPTKLSYVAIGKPRIEFKMLTVNVKVSYVYEDKTYLNYDCSIDDLGIGQVSCEFKGVTSK